MNDPIRSGSGSTRGVIALSALCLLAAPAARGGENPKVATPKVAKAVEPARDLVVPSKIAEPIYVIGPEDVIQVSVWKNDDVSRVVPVRPDGMISLPLASS
jgi:polysaccharide export outer membrane protein